MIADSATLGVAAVALFVLVVGYAVVGALTLLPATSGGASRIWPILNAEAIVVAVVLAVFALAPVLMPAAFLFFTMRIVWEAATVRFGTGGAGKALIWAGLAGLVLLVAFFLPWRPVVLVLGVAWVAALVGRRARPDDALADLLAFPVLPALAFALACTATHPALFLAAWIGIETFDSYALLAGKVFGRRKAFPRLSPNKTIEGLIGGAAMLLLTALVAAILLAPVSVLAALVFALLIGAFTVVGDLTASLLKRRAGVKDFPVLVPHQGGLLDIFDSWIATGGALALLGAVTGLI